jgi:cyclic pyranopterin phosphate synthase
MPATGVPKVRHDELPSLEKLTHAIRWLARECRVDRVKLTGGEPLVRSGVVGLVRALAAVPGIEEVSMTSNGALLSYHASALARAGLARVNVSLDSLDPKRFFTLTRGGKLQDVLDGIEAARTAGLTPLKINAVLHRSSWREEVPRLFEFAAARDIELRFIELMRTGTERAWAAGEQIGADEVSTWLRQRATMSDLPTTESAPARMTLVGWRGKELRVGWITSVSEPFCDRCNRLRLDARGRLRRCLMDGSYLPLVDMLDDGAGEDVRRQVEGYLAGKHPPQEMDTPLTMNTLGG